MNKLNTLLLPLLLLCFQFESKAQFGFVFNDSVKVKKNGEDLLFPWTGGLNHAQFSSIDVDFDGNEDLFIFDRSANQIRVFLKKEENGVFSYEYFHASKDLFPADLRYRVALVDYNNDGKKDIFTYGIGGVKVYKNIGNANTGLQWQLITERIQSIYSNNSPSNLYVSSVDIPAFIDVDGDGDMDILTFDISGQHVEFHKNLSMEEYGLPDSLEFNLESRCWGKFRESDLGNDIELNVSTGPCSSTNFDQAQNNNKRHSGSCILALDLNNDQVLDLILGDVSYNNVTALYNGALPTEEALMTSKDVQFPSYDIPVNIPLFPASFYLDVDHDGIKDLIISTNANGVSENLKSIWFYKNEGSDHQPDFSFRKQNFLQDQMIENGKGSIPVLVDLDEDGLMDLLLSSYFRYQELSSKTAQIQYFKNTGSAAKPEFTFVSDDWLSLSNEGFGLRMHPTFGDLNNNSKNEMILGTQDGKLHLYSKTGNAAEDFTLLEMNLKDHQNQTIEVGDFASPQLFDLNNDGLLDLIVGGKSAGILYYENIGSANQASFKLITSNLGNVDMGEPFAQDNFATPSFIRHNDTTHLFIGNKKGRIYYYTNIDHNLSDGNSFTLASDHYSFIEPGAYSAPAVVQLRDDQRYEMYVGTDLGGIWSYIADTSSALILNTENEQVLNPEIKIFPNPSKNGRFTLTSKHFKGGLTISIFDYLGRQIKEKETVTNETQIDLSIASKGLYTIIVKSSTELITIKKLVIE